MPKRVQRDRAAGGEGRVGAKWEGSVQDLFFGLREWRAVHPHATLAEIEAELDRQLTRLRAQMLTDLALASRAAQVGQVGREERAPCPECGGRMVSEGERARTVRTIGNEPVRLERDYASCTACGSQFFPPR